MKAYQLIQYHMKNISLKNLINNVVQKLFPDSLLKNQN